MRLTLSSFLRESSAGRSDFVSFLPALFTKAGGKAMPYAVGIDVGTTNYKLVLCSLPECETVSIDRFQSPKIYEGTFTDYDVEALVSGITHALHGCTQKLAQEASEIRFISIASVGESGVLVNRDGSYSKRSICWFDTEESFLCSDRNALPQ